MKRNAGGIEYELTYKKIKRLNLRVRPDGSVAVSAPLRTPAERMDSFVKDHVTWITRARQRIQTKQPREETMYSDDYCFNLFLPAMERLFELVKERVGQKPQLKVRQMKSRWGVCHPAKNYITLNKQLAGKPYEALEYVILHELVHLLHPNHQAEFHKEMARLMPDYKIRRALLK